jgi:hypothetical protein
MKLTKVVLDRQTSTLKRSAQIDYLFDAFRGSSDIYNREPEEFLRNLSYPANELPHKTWYQRLSMLQFSTEAIHSALRRSSRTKATFSHTRTYAEDVCEGLLNNLPEICAVLNVNLAETANLLLKKQRPAQLKIIYTCFRHGADLTLLRQQLKKVLSLKRPFATEPSSRSYSDTHLSLQKLDAICSVLQQLDAQVSRERVCDAILDCNLQSSIRSISVDLEMYAIATVEFARAQTTPVSSASRRF